MQPHGIVRIWVYLASTPLLWLTATLIVTVYTFLAMARRFGGD